MTKDQLPQQDLLDGSVDDQLDEGYSPPESRPATHDVGTTVEEARSGETWDQRLAQEEPDVGEGEITPDAIGRSGASAEEAAMHVIPEEELP
ncbi:MAG TPA: hypothetical protein VM097_03115 [Mycobacteriales bacterium]|nr:hypothetical protein [Mycobacteriales bacterium]